MTCILSCHWSLCVYLPFSPGRAPQSPPSNVYKRGGGLGGLLGFGWVGASKPQNPPAPYKHSLAVSCLGPWPEAQTAGGRRVPDGPDPPRLTPCRSVGVCGGMRVRVRGMALGLCAISPRWSGGGLDVRRRFRCKVSEKRTGGVRKARG